MEETQGSPLDWLQDAAPRVPAEYQARYREIFETLANDSGLLYSEDEMREHSERIVSARNDLLMILNVMQRLHPEDANVGALWAYYAKPDHERERDNG